MSKKVHIKTWGCQMNEYDSSKMADLLGASQGYQATELAEEADVLVLNTCSIREKAQEKLFHQLGRWKELKKQNPNLVIAVGGCVASQEGDAIRTRAPQVDIVFGNVRDASSMRPMAEMALPTTAAELSALRLVSTTTVLASCARSAEALTVTVIWSTAAAVSSSEAACASVRLESWSEEPRSSAPPGCAGANTTAGRCARCASC